MPIIEFNKEAIEAKIVTVAASEKITKKALSELSRELLAYVYETSDVAMVTRLIKVLTPVNKKVAAIYFPNFLGWSFNEKELTFGKKAKEKVFDKKLEATTAFLEDEANDIWKFAEDEIVLQAKPKDYAAKLTQLVTKAMKDENEGLTMKELLFAIVASEEVSLGDLMQPLGELVEVKEEEAA